MFVPSPPQRLGLLSYELFPRRPLAFLVFFTAPNEPRRAGGGGHK